MPYYSIHLKKKFKSKGFIVIFEAKDKIEAQSKSDFATLGSKWFPDINTLHEVSEKKFLTYKKKYSNRVSDDRKHN